MKSQFDYTLSTKGTTFGHYSKHADMQDALNRLEHISASFDVHPRFSDSTSGVFVQWLRNGKERIAGSFTIYGK